MKPIDFPQSTKVLQRPSTMTESECQSLPVWNDGKQCVSCWKLSFKERIKVLFHGKVWLGVLSGKTQPPVFLSGESVFVKTPIKERIKAFFAEAKESIIEAFESVREAAKQPDKRKHFVVGALISLVLGMPLVSVSLPDSLPLFSKNGGIPKDTERLKSWMPFSPLLGHCARVHSQLLFTI